MVPDQEQAEAVNGCDLCIVQKGRLLLDMFITGICLQSGSDARGDPFSHFRCSGIGKCHDQQSVNIRRMFSVTDHADDTFHQHCRLTASRGRRYQNIAVMQFDYLLLFRGKIHSHTLPLFLFLLSYASVVSCIRCISVCLSRSSSCLFSYPGILPSKPQTFL